MVRELRQRKLLDIPSGITRVVGMVLDRAWPPKIAMPPSHHIDCESRCDVAFRRGHRVFHRVLAPWATRIEKVLLSSGWSWQPGEREAFQREMAERRRQIDSERILGEANQAAASRGPDKPSRKIIRQTINRRDGQMLTQVYIPPMTSARKACGRARGLA